MSVAIRVEHLSKEYRLGVINHGMLYKDMQSWLARKLGRPDPHAQIGADHYADRDDRFWALKDLCFDIDQGDRVGIIGRNGAGKSTLLKILSRITAPTEGMVKIRGRVASLLEVGTGFHGELTGRENIYLNGAILGMKKREIDRKIDEIIDFSEIKQHIDTPVKRYSSGMYVRLAFAVAAHLDSDILLADEVLAVGDVEFQKKAISKMSDMSTSHGKTVLFVSHNMASVSRLCTKGMILERGSLASSGSAADTIKKYLRIEETDASAMAVSIEKNAYSDTVRIRSFSIVDARGQAPKGSLLQNGEYFLEIDAEIARPSSSLAMFWSLFAEDGSLIFLSDIHDGGGEAALALRKPGRKRISCRIPVEILSEARYSLEVSCVLHGIGWVIAPQQSENIFFSCIRNADSNPMQYDRSHPYTGGDRPGYLAPALKWLVADA